MIEWKEHLFLHVLDNASLLMFFSGMLNTLPQRMSSSVCSLYLLYKSHLKAPGTQLPYYT